MFATPLKLSKPLQFHNSPISRTKYTKVKNVGISVRCCAKKEELSCNYYELLGVSANSNVQQIKEAYRKLQKKHHPDIAGSEGHDYTLMLNEAYQTLMSNKLRRNYDAVIGDDCENFARKHSDLQSSWNGPVRPQALFVDQNKCIGCQECIYHACKTFVMDEAFGSARVQLQYGDHEHKIQVSIDSCPVNCIHWVDSEELPLLEFLSHPQRKEGYGVFGGGWERPSDVFVAVKKLKKELKRKSEKENSIHKESEVETAAQAKARYHANMKLQVDEFFKMFGALAKMFDKE